MYIESYITMWNVKHSKIIESDDGYSHLWLCMCSTRHIAPPNEVEQTEVKTDYRKV